MEQVQRYAPFPGFGNAWDAQGVCAAEVADDCFSVGERDYVSSRDDVVYANEGRAESVGYHGNLVVADV